MDAGLGYAARDNRERRDVAMVVERRLGSAGFTGLREIGGRVHLLDLSFHDPNPQGSRCHRSL